MISFIAYTLCFILLLISFTKDSEKTKKSFIKGLKSFENIMPQFILVVFIISIVLSILDTKSISNIIGNDSGVKGLILSSIFGSITTMPTFVAFSTGNTFLNSGAGYVQAVAFVSTSTLVGVLTFNLECKYIGKKVAFYRNLLAFIFSILISIIIGKVMIL